MSKKTSKTTEELTEEFFAAERAEYEKRVPAAFPRVAVKALSELAESAEVSEPEPAAEEETGRKGAAETRGQNRER